ncbi:MULTISPECIES: hypothetical protein [Peribacillus]|uniref:hypothetical protein n=1 Tax=Peribacillus TaxID=2675229 RepID=UPI0024E263AE|nr:hypothetical protein [Peribacillus simplex]MDF9762259.1 hypothetical protein [Peribacillus simplex]
MYNYNHAFNPYNVPYYIDGERIPGPGGGQWDGHGGGYSGGQWDGHGGGHGGGQWDGHGGGHGGGQWDGHGGGHGGGQWDGHGGGHGGGHWEHGQWVPRCRRVWVHGFGWTWICR